MSAVWLIYFFFGFGFVGSIRGFTRDIRGAPGVCENESVRAPEPGPLVTRGFDGGFLDGITSSLSSC